MKQAPGEFLWFFSFLIFRHSTNFYFFVYRSYLMLQLTAVLPEVCREEEELPMDWDLITM